MTTRSRLEAELATRRYTRRHAREIVTGILGNNAGVVVATTSTRWYWLRLHGDPNQVVRAWNAGFVPPVNNLPVDVEIIKANGLTDYQIIGVSINKGVSADVYAGATGMHALQHQRRDFNTGGFDPLDVYARAIVQLRARAQATPDMTLYVEPGFYPVAGLATYFAGGNSPAFTAPAGGFRCDLLYLDNTGTLQIVTGAVAPLGTPVRPAQPTANDLPLAYVYLTVTTTAITEYIIEDARVIFGGGAVGTHGILSATHSDALVGAVLDGDIIIGNVTPKWSRLAIAIPAANVRNVLGVDNGELRPSWKTALDATAPSTQAFGDAASAGTSLVFSHRDHKHAMPATPVTSFAKSGSAALTGAVTLSEGSNITLTQAGQNIAIASTGGASLTVQEADAAPTVANVTTIIVPNGSLTDNGGGSVTFTPSGAGDVVGPAGATDGNLAVFDGASGKLLKDGGAPTGAPTTAKYVTTASDAGLSAEVAIPGLAGSPDIAGAGGAGTSEEFDGAEPFTWSVAPAVHDSNTTILSHFYAKTTTSNSFVGTKAWTPGAGAVDARAKISLGGDSNSNQRQIGLYIANSDDSAYIHCHLVVKSSGNGSLARAYKYASPTATQIGADQTVNGLNTIYVRLARDAGTTWNAYYSTDGVLWYFIGTTSLTMTIAKIGFFIYTADTGTYYYASDWLRTSV